MPLKSKPILTNTSDLASRWNCCTRTVLRIAKCHELEPLRLRPRGRIYFRLADIEALEAEVHLRRA